MRKFSLAVGLAGFLVACGTSNDNGPTNQAVAQPKKKPAYCFFKDEEMTGWTAKRDKEGNVTLAGKAHVKDPRYKAILGTPDVKGTSASVAPTILQNDTGYGAPDDTWNLTASIPNSQAVTSVIVTCGDKNVAQLEVPAKG